MNDCTIDIDDVSSSSGSSSFDESDDDDEGGVFFGKHSEAESRFLANVSRTPPLQSPSPPSKGSRRQSRLVSRLRKDSTEFHRRKTMLLAPPAIVDDEQQEEHSMRERYQREISVLQISPSVLTSVHHTPPTSPSRSLCATLEQLHVAAFPVQDASDESDSASSEDLSDCLTDSSNADSDKENVRIEESPVPSRRRVEEDRSTGTTGIIAHSGEMSCHFTVCTGEQDDFAEGEYNSGFPSYSGSALTHSAWSGHGWPPPERLL